MGIRSGDVVTICMPNVPQALDCFYALNRIGAVANMVHPLSAQSEITFYVNFSKSKAILTLDLFAGKVAKALEEADPGVKLLVARNQEELPLFLRPLYVAKEGRKYLRLPEGNVQLWSQFLKMGKKDVELPESVYDTTRTSVILYSGGTSGTPKGICLSDLNFNACALQAGDAIQHELYAGCTMLSCMPCFHGFGLGSICMRCSSTAPAVFSCPLSTERAMPICWQNGNPTSLQACPPFLRPCSTSLSWTKWT